MDRFGKFLFVFFAGFLIAYLLTPLARRWALWAGMIDPLEERRIHRAPTPRGGGLAIVIAFHATYLLAVPLFWMPLAGGLTIHWWRSFLLASTVLVLFGLLDDWRSLRPWVKLGGQTLASFVLCLSGNRIGTLLGIHLPLPLDFALTVFWLVAVTNAFNLIDGLDGLATGLALISALGLAGALFFRGLPIDALVPLALAGACLAFLRYNFYPASVFLGDSGSMFLGFTLAAVALTTGSKSTFMASVAVPVLAVGVPLFDTLLAIWRRSLRMLFPRALPDRPKSTGVMQPDAEHLHHRFLNYGLQQPQVALFLYLVSAAMVAIGLLSLIFRTRATGIFLLAFVGGSYVVVRHLARVELWDTGRAIVSGLHRPPPRVLASVLYPGGDVAFLLASLGLSILLTNRLPMEVALQKHWLRIVPLWISPVFLGLCAMGVYSTAWSRARFGDYLLLSLGLLGGVLVSFGTVSLFTEGPSRADYAQVLIFASVSQVGIVGSRFWVRGIRELMSLVSQSPRFHRAAGAERVLLYGAGGKCQLFLREESMSVPEAGAPRIIVGIVDDDPNLRLRRVYGYRVLGNGSDLPLLIRLHDIHRVVIVTDLPDDARRRMCATAEAQRITLSEWRYEERLLYRASAAPDAPRTGRET